MLKAQLEKYKDKLKDRLYWHLKRKRPFIINGEYKIELLQIEYDRDNPMFDTAKIRVTNLKNEQVEVLNIEHQS